VGQKVGVVRIAKIPKGGGKLRTIYCPNSKEKRQYRALLPKLHELHAKLVEQHGTRGVAHAFVPNRNPVTCALPHCGFKVTVSCDLSNWFDSVTMKNLLDAGFPPELAEAVTLPDEQGVRRLRQGLPTSPVAANIAAVTMDADILWYLSNIRRNSQDICHTNFDFTYTRYADDINVSFTVDFDDDGIRVLVQAIVKMVAMYAAMRGWTVAEHKTRVQRAEAGRRIIVGIAVDDYIHATRKTRRKLRAARHRAALCKGHKKRNKAAMSASGLAEWAACKLPRLCRGTRQVMGVLASISASAPQATTTEAPRLAAYSGSGRGVLVEVKDEKL
jgi:hypothetical protein